MNTAPPIGLFTKLAQTTRALIPDAGKSGFDLAVNAALGQVPAARVNAAILRMTAAQRAGFATGCALKTGMQHPEFVAKVHGSYPSVQMGAIAFPKVILPVRTGVFLEGPSPAASPPVGTVTVAGKPLPVSQIQSEIIGGMVATATQIATGTPPTSAANAVAQDTVAKMLSGAAVGLGSGSLGAPIVAALGGSQAAAAAAVAPVLTNPTTTAGALSHPLGVQAATLSLDPWHKFVSWIKGLFGPRTVS